MELAASPESRSWLTACTDDDLTVAIQSSRRRDDILDLIDDLEPENWVTLDQCVPRDQQLIYLIMDSWDKPSSGTYHAAENRIHLYGEKYQSIPANRKAMYWKPCELPPGVPRKRDFTPSAPRPAGNAYRSDMRNAESAQRYPGRNPTGDFRGNRDQDSYKPKPNTHRGGGDRRHNAWEGK